MQVTQIHELVNAATTAILGESGVVEEDLSNLVDVGNAVFSASAVDNYVKKLVDHIGKVSFVSRVYSGAVPSVLMDSWEFGSVLEKISAEMPVATENDSWDLTDGATYSPDVFYKPSVSAKFFNSKVTFEIPLSFTERQVKSSFSSAAQMNGFLSMLTTAVENSMTVKLDSLIMRTVNHMIGEVIYDGLWDATAVPPALDTKATSVRCVNLLKLFNTEFSQTLTASKCLTDEDFIRYSTYVMSLYTDRMARISTLFNVSGKERFTPKSDQHLVLLSDFAKASETFLLSKTFNAERLVLPNHETVPYWQGSGEDYEFSDISAINVKTAAGNVVSMTGVLGVLFDRDALGVTNLDQRVTTNYNPKAEFYTNFYKLDAGFFNDLDENFVVFFAG